jgi:hypothetical protein
MNRSQLSATTRYRSIEPNVILSVAKRSEGSPLKLRRDSSLAYRLTQNDTMIASIERYWAATARPLLFVICILVVAGDMGANAWAHPTTYCQDDPVADSSTPGGVKNGNFADWKDNLPVGWDVDIGATDGARKPESRIAKGEGPSLELSGDATTRAWRFVSQSVDAKPGAVIGSVFRPKRAG